MRNETRQHWQPTRVCEVCGVREVTRHLVLDTVKRYLRTCDTPQCVETATARLLYIEKIQKEAELS